MSYDLYDITIIPLIKITTSLLNILQLASEHAATNSIDPESFASGQLAPDMFPLTFQVHTTCAVGLKAVSDLAEHEVEDYDKIAETKLSDLITRTQTTLSALQKVERKQIAGKDSNIINIKKPNGSVEFSALDAVNNYFLPNAYFHLVTAYGILRAKGVPVGKAVFLSGFQSVPS